MALMGHIPFPWTTYFEKSHNLLIGIEGSECYTCHWNWINETVVQAVKCTFLKSNLHFKKLHIFVIFRIEGQKFGPFLSKYVNNKSWSPILVFFNEKKIRKIRLIFDIEKWLWKPELCFMWPSIPKQSKFLEHFYGCFHRPYSPLNSASA